MTWFSYSLLFASLIVFAVAWLKGGHPERFGVMILAISFLISAASPPVKVLGDLILFDALTDTGLLLLFLWMSFKGDRWWPLLATATMVLTAAVHAAMVLIPALDTRADMSARMGLTVLLLMALMVGVGERWLAGEPPVSDLRDRHGYRGHTSA